MRVWGCLESNRIHFVSSINFSVRATGDVPGHALPIRCVFGNMEVYGGLCAIPHTHNPLLDYFNPHDAVPVPQSCHRGVAQTEFEPVASVGLEEILS